MRRIIQKLAAVALSSVWPWSFCSRRQRSPRRLRFWKNSVPSGKLEQRHQLERHFRHRRG